MRFKMIEGDSIGRILIIETNAQNIPIIDDLLEKLKSHPDFELLCLSHEPILSLPGLEIVPKVITIPATRSRYTAAPINSRDKRKVAGYARVSTDHEEQQTSYEAQVDYYTNYIKGREDWEFVSVYTDEGISATSTTKRDGFNKMVADALLMPGRSGISPTSWRQRRT